MTVGTTNFDNRTVQGFGKEWNKFTQEALTEREREELFAKYFGLIDWTRKPQRALDMGCGSGRWDVLVAPLVRDVVAAGCKPRGSARRQAKCAGSQCIVRGMHTGNSAISRRTL